MAASASWSAPFMSFLTCTMPTQSHLCGPKAPTKSWPASPASPSARQMPKLHNLCHEPLLQDTSQFYNKTLQHENVHVHRHIHTHKAAEIEAFKLPDSIAPPYLYQRCGRTDFSQQP